jgi:hypothetical protein
LALRLIDDASIAGNSGDNPTGTTPSLRSTAQTSMPPNSRIKATTKFSLADIVQGAQVQEATLSVFHIADETGRSPTDGVFGLDDVRWKEETVSFDNPPGGSYGATDTPKLDDSTYTDGVAGRVNFDVTDYVQQKLDAGADSITFKAGARPRHPEREHGFRQQGKRKRQCPAAYHYWHADSRRGRAGGPVERRVLRAPRGEGAHGHRADHAGAVAPGV